MYEVLTILCDDEEYCLKWAIYLDNCKVSLEQLGKSLKQGGWVESFVINSFCRKLFRKSHPKQSGKHFFFNTVSDYFLEKWKTEGARLEWKDRDLKCFKGASLARPLHLAERLYFPTVFNSHWFVLVCFCCGYQVPPLSFFGFNLWETRQLPSHCLGVDDQKLQIDMGISWVKGNTLQ